MEAFFADRLLSARKMAGLSLQGLASAMDHLVSRQALHKYEQGKMMPDQAVVLALANALNVSVDYFFHAPAPRFTLKRVAYLKHAPKLSKADDISIRERVIDVFDRCFELERLMNLSLKKVFFEFDRVVKHAMDAEAAAKQLRLLWGLGDHPIPDVVALLEDKGYRVFELSAPVAFWGMKADVQQEKIIVLRRSSSKADNDPVLRRFIALHELAHHALRFKRGLKPREVEDLCSVFAEAVLYPEEMARKELQFDRSHFFEYELVLLKERWGLSVYVVMHRALSLGLTSPRVFKAFLASYKQRGYHVRAAEPGKFLAKELPVRMRRLVLLALAKEVLTLNEAAYYAGMSAWQLREHLRLMV